MSETGGDAAPAPAAPARSSGGNVFARKLGPLPMWAWMGVALAVALAYYLWKKDKSTTAAGSATAGTTSTSTGTGTTDSSLIPQFVNQTYVNSAPPSAPGVPGPPGATGATGTAGAAAPAQAQASIYPAPQSTTASKLSNTSVKVNWAYITSATPKPASYTVAAYTPAGKLAQQITVNAPDTASGIAQASLSGLTAGQKYTIHVWANGGKSAPPHSTADVTL